MNEMKKFCFKQSENLDHIFKYLRTSVCSKQTFNFVFSKFILFLFEVFILH